MRDDGGLGSGKRYQIGKLKGIPIYITLFFIILTAYALLKVLVYDGHPTHLIWLGTLFCIIVVHELGHAMAASHYGNKILGITLHLFGGVMEHRGKLTQGQQIVVALAGPAVHVVMIPIALVLDHFFASGAGLIVGTLIRSLLWWNIILLVFNLLPVYPLDGGKVARVMLTKYLGPVRGIVVGSAIALVVVVSALAYTLLFGHYQLSLLGLLLIIMLGIVNLQEFRKYRDVESTMRIKPVPLATRFRRFLRRLRWRVTKKADVRELIERAEREGFDSLEPFEQQALERRKYQLQTEVTLRGFDSLAPSEQRQLHEIHAVLHQEALRN